MTPLDRINLYTANRQGLISREERDARLARDCAYCDSSGWIEMDNNGPIVGCPVCNANEERSDDR